VLAKINEVLSDDSRRALYDEQGIIDEDDDEKFGSTWLEAFKHLFKPITDSDIDNYRKEYIGKRYFSMEGNGSLLDQALTKGFHCRKRIGKF
jgi:curved DNA-binding protein CbpA